MLEMWIIWDGRMLRYGLAGRSQNILFNLYLIDPKIEYQKKKIIVTPARSDTRFGNVWIFCFRLCIYVWFCEIPNNHGVMVS